jgi:hypothetical protein
MADEFDSEGHDELRDDLLGEDAEDRPCAFCGAAIHPSSHRCPECGGHVGLAWGTVHKEQFLFLFAACCMAVGCLASWDQTRPSAFNGLQTIRGTTIFALSLYGLIAGTIAVFNRRTLIWPFFIGALEALWVGVEAITNVWGGPKWEEYGKAVGPWYRHVRAIPPGFWLLTIGGALVVIAVLKGVVGGFAGAKAKAKVTSSDRATTASERRRSRMAAAGSTAPPPPPAGVDPISGGPLPPPPPPV